MKNTLQDGKNCCAQSWIGRLNTVKRDVLPKAVCRFMESRKVPMLFFKKQRITENSFGNTKSNSDQK